MNFNFILAGSLKSNEKNSSSTNSCSSFTDGWLGMVAGNVVEPDAVVVEVVEDGQAELVTLAVVRLGTAKAGNF